MRFNNSRPASKEPPSLPSQGPQQRDARLDVDSRRCPSARLTRRMRWRSAWRVVSLCLCLGEVLRKLSAAATRRTDPRAVLRQADLTSAATGAAQRSTAARRRQSCHNTDLSRQLVQASGRVTPSDAARRPAKCSNCSYCGRDPSSLSFFIQQRS